MQRLIPIRQIVKTEFVDWTCNETIIKFLLGLLLHADAAIVRLHDQPGFTGIEKSDQRYISIVRYSYISFLLFVYDSPQVEVTSQVEPSDDAACSNHDIHVGMSFGFECADRIVDTAHTKFAHLQEQHPMFAEALQVMGNERRTLTLIRFA